MGESVVGVERVELLCLGSLEGGEDEVGGFVVTDVVGVVALDFISNIGEELREEGSFGDFVKSNELQAGQGVIRNTCRWCAIGQTAMGCYLDVGERNGGVRDGRETIWQGKLEWSGRYH